MLRKHFGFDEISVDSLDQVSQWMEVNAQWFNKEKVTSEAYRKFRELKVEPPSTDRMTRFVDSVASNGEMEFFNDVDQKLSTDTKEGIDFLINTF